MESFKIAFMLLGYLFSLTVIAALAFMGAAVAVDPQRVLIAVSAALLVNIIAFVLAMDVNRTRYRGQ